MNTLAPTPPRPHRLMVNVDDETMEAVRALAYAYRISQSAAAADVLRHMVPMVLPVAKELSKIREAPVQAMEALAERAGLITEQALTLIGEARARKAPPSSNTGG